LKKYDSSAILIFINPPSIDSLKERLVTRGTETEENMKIRLKRAEKENEKTKNFDYIIVNEYIKQATEEIKNIILQNK
jgi:guanylate kinase